MTTILFDLDGTLLPMDQAVFAKDYFKLLYEKAAPLGYRKLRLFAGVYKGVKAMVKNDGSRVNEEVFWETFSKIAGKRVYRDREVFYDFYRNEFQQAARSCGFNPEAKKLVDDLKKEGFRVVLATNPVFPQIATMSRIRWAGLVPEDFEYITVYENSRYCKPNPEYYVDILKKIQCLPEECLMVGNDAKEDLAAAKIGIDTFLLTDCLINSEKKDISGQAKGGFSELRKYINGCNHGADKVF